MPLTKTRISHVGVTLALGARGGEFDPHILDNKGLVQQIKKINCKLKKGNPATCEFTWITFS